MDPEAFWPHEGTLFMMKQEVVKRGRLLDAQSSKKLKGSIDTETSKACPTPFCGKRRGGRTGHRHDGEDQQRATAGR